MSLKFKLDSLDGLDEATQKLYEKKGDKYVLIVDGMDDGDLGGLKTQVEKLLGEKKELQKKLKDKDDAESTAREEARKATEDAAAKKGDIEALRRSADERVAAAISEAEAKYKPQVEKLNGTVRKLLVDNVATAMAAKIGLKGSESLLIPHITARLDVEERDGDHATVIRDSKGSASALTLDDLEKEFKGNAAFAPVLAGSQGSGGGAGGPGNKSGGAAGAKTMKRSEFDALSPSDRSARMKEKVTLVDD